MLLTPDITGPLCAVQPQPCHDSASMIAVHVTYSIICGMYSIESLSSDCHSLSFWEHTRNISKRLLVQVEDPCHQ